MNRLNFLRVTTNLLVTLKLQLKMSADTKKIITTTETAVPSSSSHVDLSLLLDCISQVESNRDDRKVGKAGELSQYQITGNVWNQHFPSLNFFLGCHGIQAWQCAENHLEWLDRNIPRETAIEKDFREYALAWAWNGGLKSWGLAYSLGYDEKTLRLNNYAVRVTNLYTDARRSLLHPRP